MSSGNAGEQMEAFHRWKDGVVLPGGSVLGFGANLRDVFAIWRDREGAVLHRRKLGSLTWHRDSRGAYVIVHDGVRREAPCSE